MRVDRDIKYFYFDKWIIKNNKFTTLQQLNSIFLPQWLLLYCYNIYNLRTQYEARELQRHSVYLLIEVGIQLKNGHTQSFKKANNQIQIRAANS